MSTTAGPPPGHCLRRPATSIPSRSGEPDVQEHKIGAKPVHGLEPFVAGRALADYVEAVGFEQGARRMAEPCVVVDDEDGLRHRERMPKIP